MSGVQSVERALAILRALSTGPARVTEIASRTNLPKSTVSRLLSTLEQLDAVEQAGNGGPYRLGSLVAEIAGATGPTRALPELAQPFLAELSLLTGEAAGLSVREGGMVRYLAQTTPADEVQVRDWTGAEIPVHVTPSGLVILAHLPEAEVDEILAQPLPRYTDATVTDPDTIRAAARGHPGRRQHLAAGGVRGRCQLGGRTGVRPRRRRDRGHPRPRARRTGSPASARQRPWPATSGLSRLGSASA